ncbi:MAG: SDR family NAD(P)-dependent oxidoreductase [Gemmatimonadota bacterium]|nr:SDR family NAD(P)-dependent oxidoreductase [Gemmatimonadota bacterium]
MRVLVSGASSGIGRAICERLLADGHRAIGIARDFGKFPCDDRCFETHAIDLADLDKLPTHLQTLVTAYPALDALVLNAGVGRFGALEQFSYDQIRAQIDLNLTSHVFVARAFLPSLKKAGRGHLVFMGSEAALAGTAQGSLYCAAKFALRGLAQALRAECARAGVRVTLVNPGMVQSPFFDELDFRPGPEPDNYILPEDIAEVIAQALTARDGTVLDEINLSPQKKVIEFGTRKKR